MPHTPRKERTRSVYLYIYIWLQLTCYGDWIEGVEFHWRRIDYLVWYLGWILIHLYRGFGYFLFCLFFGGIFVSLFCLDLFLLCFFEHMHTSQSFLLFVLINGWNTTDMVDMDMDLRGARAHVATAK